MQRGEPQVRGNEWQLSDPVESNTPNKETPFIAKPANTIYMNSSVIYLALQIDLSLFSI